MLAQLSSDACTHNRATRGRASWPCLAEPYYSLAATAPVDISRDPHAAAGSMWVPTWGPLNWHPSPASGYLPFVVSSPLERRPPRCLWLCQHPAAILMVSASFFWNNFNYFQACNLAALTTSTLLHNHRRHYHPLSELSSILNVSIP